MARPILTLAFAATVATAACGGGSAEGPGEPLLSGSLTGEFQGQPFTPMFGFTTLYNGSNLIALGDGPLNCASPQRPDPPSGTNAYFTISTLEIRSTSSVLVQVLQNKGNFYGTGSNTGSVSIAAVTDSAVAGSVDYHDTIDGQTYGIAGTFEVMRCPN